MTSTSAAPAETTHAHSQEQPDTVRSALRNPRQLKSEILAGIVVALALIPEAISFSILAGVPPQVGLFSSFVMAVTIAVVGGRPAMISATTGAIALVIAPVAHEYGLDYFIATVILAGLFQIVLALLGVAKLMRFIPRSVMTGFVNALAILIFTAQLPHLFGEDIPWIVYPLVVVGLLIMFFVPRLTTVVPAPLIAIVLLTIVVVVSGWKLPNVSDQGELPESLPELFIPNVPLNLETLQIIAPYALAMAIVGIMESLMTAKLVDDITDTHSNKTRESWGQGVANMISGFFGGMGGCAMIGQTMINVKQSGARTRISTFLAGVFLLIMVIALNDIVGLIPMAALVAVMIMVSVATMDWHSIRPSTLRLMPWSETAVMLVTVIATVATHNLAIGVVLGVVTAMILFARRVAHLVHIEKVWETDVDGDGTVDIRRYAVKGELFWASSNDLVYQFDYAGDPEVVIVDLTAADIWDASTVATLDAVQTKYAARGKEARIIGLDGASLQRLERLSGQLGDGH
ncbi:SulP family inorganic anion transporter [Brachybacterium paraconglomeratum]|uniref:SulP family inorganic anion transporter n=1 Tax=Brachybacterium paraconglomeratum TaxID=173362 RepID=UPI00223A79CF|nr:SulP family inorganic anion transporter [Brachybacterium paraconglomeratum]MCT1437688.1 SulP family inorganic anion transporter [Brachybacterium paraconglomeratum]